MSEIIIHASLARKASSEILDFHRVDYPAVEPKEWKKLVTVKLQDEKVVTGDLPLNYYLAAPYGSSFKENYDLHAELSDVREKNE